MTTLNTRAMLVSLNISAWTARRYDRKVSNEVAERYATNQNAGRYNKRLLPVDAASYDAVWSAIGAARQAHYEQTLPWSDDGSRILPAMNYLDYCAEMRKRREAFDQAVTLFLAEYPSLREQARVTLNGLYQDEDYPSVEHLLKRFSFSTHVLPLPSGNDFRVDLQGEDVEAIREQIERDTEQAISAAVGDIYQRILDQVSHLRALVTGDGMVRRATIENLRELCQLLPRLNLTADERLVALGSRISEELACYEAGDLSRKRKGARKRVAETAAKIEADLAAFMGKSQ